VKLNIYASSRLSKRNGRINPRYRAVHFFIGTEVRISIEAHAIKVAIHEVGSFFDSDSLFDNLRIYTKPKTDILLLQLI
jgi:hypothetical protein